MNNVIPLKEYANTNYKQGHEQSIEEILIMDHIDTHDVCKVAFGYVFTNKRSYTYG